MKKLINLLFLLSVSLFSFSQNSYPLNEKSGKRSIEDSLNYSKTRTLMTSIEKNLDGIVTQEKIANIVDNILSVKGKKQKTDFFSVYVPGDLPENKDGYMTYNFLYQILSLLENKKVTTEITELKDYYNFYRSGSEKTDYYFTIRINFKNDNSFGKNVENSIELTFDLIKNELSTLMYQLEKA